MDVDQVMLDVGLGMSYSLEYMGLGDNDVLFWFILKNIMLGMFEGEKQGFLIMLLLCYMGECDSGDYDCLIGFDNIDVVGEVGLWLNYVIGLFSSYGMICKGFGGYEGVVGEIGICYCYQFNDKLILWIGVEL